MRSVELSGALVALALLMSAGCSQAAPEAGAASAAPATQAQADPYPVDPPEGVELDVPYVPTPEGTVAAMLKLGEVDAADYVIDLGSGDGRIAVGAGRLGARAFGVDINPVRIAEAQANAKSAGVAERVTFRRQDLFKTPIADATVLTMYLLPSVNLTLRPRILDELRPGTRVMSHQFDLGDWTPDQTVEVENGATVHLWIVPAKVAGRWTLTGPGAGPLELTQTYSQLTGSLSGRPIRDGRVRGDRLQFVADTADGPRLFAGRIAGGRVTPAAPPAPPQGVEPAQPAAAAGWSLTRAS